MAVAVKNSTDQKKIILAAGLGLLAIIALWWTFFGFGGSSKPTPKPTRGAVAAASPVPARSADAQPEPDQSADSAYIRTINLGESQPAIPEPRRNIFAFYVPTPTPTPKQVVVVPTPAPPPPLLLASLSPANVYARTEDFTLQVTGDKFTPAVHIVMDGRELPTRFVSPQQLSATVPAAMIATAGARGITVKSSDGSLYSAPTPLIVAAPPVPNYSYVGLIARKTSIGDTAILMDKSNKDMLSVQRGDVLHGGFRVTSISDSEVLVVDVKLKITHPIKMSSDGGDRASFPQGRQPPRVAAEDDEP